MKKVSIVLLSAAIGTTLLAGCGTNPEISEPENSSALGSSVSSAASSPSELSSIRPEASSAITESSSAIKTDSSSPESSGSSVSSWEESLASSDSSSVGQNTARDYQAEILGLRKSQDFNESSIILIKFKFTNYDEEPTSFGIALNQTMYQDNEELSVEIPKDSTYDSSKYLQEVGKGESLEIDLPVKLRNTVSPVKVEVNKSFGNDGWNIVETLPLP